MNVAFPAVVGAAGAVALLTVVAFEPAAPPAAPPSAMVVAAAEPSRCASSARRRDRDRDDRFGWPPYNCATSPWNRRISAHPAIAPYSAAVIAQEFAHGNTQPIREQEAGKWDYGHPVYFARPDDPVVAVQCDPRAFAGGHPGDTCDTADHGGIPARIRVPARARPAGGDDSHLAVVQPDGTEIDFWAAQRPSGDWGTPGNTTVRAGGGANCGDWRTAEGWDRSSGGWPQTAGGACLAGGLLRAEEMLSGRIDHALAIGLQCAIGSQYPAFPGAVTDDCTSKVGPPLGGRLWYDVPDEVTRADPKLKPWEKAVLTALHDYGGYLMDDVAGGVSVSGMLFATESAGSAYALGRPDPYAALASQGWYARPVAGSYTTRWIGADPWQPRGVDFLHHMHWLAPCSAQGTC